MKRSLFEAAGLLAVGLAWPLTAAATFAPVPEPELWSLLGVAAVAGAVVTWRRRRATRKGRRHDR